MDILKSEGKTVSAKKIQLFFQLYGVLMVAFAIIGAFRAYTPIPYSDMWPGGVEFYARIVDGDWRAWFQLHNEHPNTLARLSYYADMRWFSGLGRSLIVTNYAIVAVFAFVLCLFVREADKGNKADYARTSLYCFIVGSAYYWCQDTNLTWEFQVSFFWAQTLPLCALLFLYKSTLPQVSSRHFWLACLFGVASVGTMGNGLLVFPLMVLVSIALRQPAKRVIFFAALSVAMLALYHISDDKELTSQIVHNEHNIDSLSNKYFDMLVFFCAYLGAPFSFVVGRGAVGNYAATPAGVVFLVLSLFQLRQLAVTRNSLQASLLGYVTFVLVTGVAISVNRIGVSGPTIPKYTTVTLFGWLALLAMFTPQILSLLRQRKRAACALLCIIPAAMLAGQTPALKSRHKEVYRKTVDAVALSLGTRLQTPEIANIWVKPVLVAQKKHISIYSIYPYRDIAEQYGTTISPAAARPASGGLSSVERLPYDNEFLRVSGWISDAEHGEIPQLVRCLDEGNTVVGFALTGARDGKASASAGNSGFQGYVKASVIGATVTFLGDAPLCQFKVQITPEPLRQ